MKKNTCHRNNDQEFIELAIPGFGKLSIDNICSLRNGTEIKREESVVNLS
jgi:hypothetical protein